MKPRSECDICTKYITPALKQATWDKMHQIREEATFTAGGCARSKSKL